MIVMEIDLDKILIVDMNPYLEDYIEYMKKDESLKTFYQYKDSKNVKVVMYSGNVIGLATVVLTSGVPELQAAIFDKFQRQGLGTALFNKLTAMYFKENYPMVNLKINKFNEKAIGWVSKTGFIRDDTKEELNPDNKEDLYYTFYKINPNYNKNLGR